jgi:cytosine deaminase
MTSVTVTDVEKAASLAAEQAIMAFDQGTFSVGGLLLDSQGNLIHALHNNVVMRNLTFDPTAHGERQMIDWYYSEIGFGKSLPPPDQLTIVTSLDPCCMCAGSILTGGFNVTVAAFDTESGINYNTKADFPTLAPPLQQQARKTFSYPAVSGSTSFKRPASGAPLPRFFAQQVIEEQTQALSLSIFLATLNSVRESVSHDLPPSELKDPKTLAYDDPIREALRTFYRPTLQYRAPARSRPDSNLMQFLQWTAKEDKEAGGPGQAVALLDYFGNLLLCIPGNIGVSPILTSFMRTTRAYAELRYVVAQWEGQSKRAFEYLCHPKYGTFVFLLGPDKSSSSLVDLGAYGSTMEGPLPPDNPNQFQYVKASIPPAELTAYCKGLPPLYSKVIKVNPVRAAFAEDS